MTNRIIQGWSSKPAGRPVRPAGFAMCLAGSLLAIASPPAAAAPVSAVAASMSVARDRDSSSPDWFSAGQGRAAHALIDLLQSSSLDGLDPKSFKIESLERAVRGAEEGDPKLIAKAEAQLDRALVAYTAALREQRSPEWIINDPEAVPGRPSASALLSKAAAASSLEDWIANLRFMHPSYAGLRNALAGTVDERERRLLQVNLDRARLLPADGRYIVVNAAAQRLEIYEDGKLVDGMRVVVGKQANPTPMMAAMIRYTATNPYWNVPPDLAAERIAPNVLKEGPAYLQRLGYVVLSDWSEAASPVDPSTIDWQAVADGKVQIRVRQEPGPHNSMGRMKFMFPNAQGVYLHDTPDKQLLNEAARLFSGGCVRLEDAPRLAKWMYGEPLETKGGPPERKVPLDRAIPVYIAYLTAVPSGGEIVFYDDIYGRDDARMVALGQDRLAAR